MNDPSPSPSQHAAAQAREAHRVALAQSPQGALLAVLHLGETHSALAIGRAGDAPQVHTLDLGVQALLARHLRHAPPTPLELEAAIEAVEDVVMPLHRLLPANAELVMHLPPSLPLRALLDGDAAAPDAPHDIDTVERAFDRLAAVSQGRPLSQEPALADPAVAAALLILRELMHHLGFAHVRLQA